MAKFDSIQHMKPEEQQINKVVVHERHSLAMTGHENGAIRLFDLNASKP